MGQQDSREREKESESESERERERGDFDSGMSPGQDLSSEQVSAFRCISDFREDSSLLSKILQ